LYPVVNGATTIWERLNSYTHEEGFGGNNSMNSFNHYSFGAVGAWMYNYSLGIKRYPGNPGFKTFLLEPTPDPTKNMTFAMGHYDSSYGKIESEWQYEKNGIKYEFTIPANTNAFVSLSADDIEDISNGEQTISTDSDIQNLTMKDGKVNFQLGSGHYIFYVKE
jgi:alpha-L-rhamnosidase